MEGTNIIYDPHHVDKQDHLCFHLCIHMDILLASLTCVQSLDNKLDDPYARISFQRDIRNCNVLSFAETWINPGIPDILFLSMDINLPGAVDWVIMQSGFLFMPVPEKQEKCGRSVSSSSPSWSLTGPAGRPGTSPTGWSATGSGAA